MQFNADIPLWVLGIAGAMTGALAAYLGLLLVRLFKRKQAQKQDDVS